MKAQGTISVVNWSEFQHYRDRNPPWIKLHAKLLDNYEFSCLQDASKALAFCIWILAARHDNAIPNDTEWIRARVGFNPKTDIQKCIAELVSAGFLTMSQDASNMLAGRLQDASCKAEHRDRAQRQSAEAEGENTRSAKPSAVPESVDELRAYMTEIGVDESEAERMWDYYASKGWKVGRDPMKDWKAAARNWKRKAEEYGRNHGRTNGTQQNGAATNGKRNNVPTAQEYVDLGASVSATLGIQ